MGTELLWFFKNVLECWRRHCGDTDSIVLLLLLFFNEIKNTDSSCTLSTYHGPDPLLVLYILRGRHEYLCPTDEETEAGPRSHSLQVVSWGGAWGGWLVLKLSDAPQAGARPLVGLGSLSEMASSTPLFLPL